MFLDERPASAPEPDTTFEPASPVGNEREQTSNRRAAKLVSHAGVGVAGAGGVLAAQQVSRTAGEPTAASASLDVFQDAGSGQPEPGSRGISNNAEPLNLQPAPSTQAGIKPAGGDPVPEPVEPPPAVDFAVSPPPEQAGASQSPEFTRPAEPEDLARDELDAVTEELERETFLASAGAEIGGGFAPDVGDTDVDGIFGASSEIGGMPLDGRPGEDEDDDGLASSP